MSEDELEPTVVKGKIIDNMSVIDEYTTGMLASAVGMTEAEIEPYLEEMAENDRIRKRDSGPTTKWVRFK
jgi:hypothetical protein